MIDSYFEQYRIFCEYHLFCCEKHLFYIINRKEMYLK